MAIWLVTKVADDGTNGTLRWAILQACSDGAANPTIKFNIAPLGTARVIQVNATLGDLPALCGPITIDGFSQGGPAGAVQPWIGGAGVAVEAAVGTTIGGTVAGQGNVISGNIGSGIWLSEKTCCTIIAGNKIGTDATGAAALGNGGSGILLENSNFINIGLSGVNGRNVISANKWGIYLSGRGWNTIANNYIGTDATGKNKMGNQKSGVRIDDNLGPSSSNTIGGISPTPPTPINIISANGAAGEAGDGFGIWVFGSQVIHTTIEGNYIGLDVDGKVPNDFGNFSDGIEVQGPNTTVGGPVDGARNYICYNGQAGVDVISAAGDLFQNNFIGLDIQSKVAKNAVDWRTGTIIEAQWISNQHN